MDAQAAARLGDEIAHGFGVAAMVAGAVAGALIGAAVVAATAATGGLAAVILAGSIAAGGLSMFQIVKGLTTIFELPEPTTGVLIRGSFNVYVNSRNAMRAGDDVSATCSGLPLNHPLWPFPVLIAEGSATVYINGKPAARLQSKMVCGAHIKTGSQDTFIGGPTERVAFVLDLEEWLHTGLEALGLAALAGGLLLAAMAGVAALAGFVAIGGLMMGGMALLGDLGDRLGPGYRDLFQGVAGMALLGFGPKLAGRRPAAVTSETAQRRAYLNNKFGRSGNLDHDINYRGNRETAVKFFKSKDIDPADAESYMNGLDFNHPVRVETLAPGKNLWQYQSPGAPQGNWYTLSPRVQPTELGINPMGTNRAANTIEPKVLNSYRTTQKVEVLRSTAAPTDDFWSVKGQSYPAKGGAQQLFSNEKGSFGLLPREDHDTHRIHRPRSGAGRRPAGPLSGIRGPAVRGKAIAVHQVRPARPQPGSFRTAPVDPRQHRREGIRRNRPGTLQGPQGRLLRRYTHWPRPESRSALSATPSVLSDRRFCLARTCANRQGSRGVLPKGGQPGCRRLSPSPAAETSPVPGRRWCPARPCPWRRPRWRRRN